VLDGVQVPMREGTILKVKGSQTRTCPMVNILKATQQGAELVWCECRSGCTTVDGGSHRHHLANTVELFTHAAAMWLYVKVL